MDALPTLQLGATPNPKSKDPSGPRNSSLHRTTSDIVPRCAPLAPIAWAILIITDLLTPQSPWRVKALINSCYAASEGGIKIEKSGRWCNHRRIRSSRIPRRVIEVLVGGCDVGWRAWQVREVEHLCRASIGLDGRKFSRCERNGLTIIDVAYTSARIAS